VGLLDAGVGLAHHAEGAVAAVIAEVHPRLEARVAGLVALAECVHCGISLAGMASGAGVLKIFEHYDLDHSGRLGEWEYTLAARDLGFGECARTVFHTLPLHPEDQTIDYSELLDSTRLSQDEKRIGRGFLKAMSWEVGVRARDVDTRGWSFTGEDAESARVPLIASDFNCL
jgi:hypothetical protein